MKVQFRLTQLNTDPVQYKPYSPTFVPETEIILELDVERTKIIHAESGVGEEAHNLIVIGPEGFKAIVTQLADMVSELDRDRTAARVRQVGGR